MLTGISRRLITYYLAVIAFIVILMGAFFLYFLNYFYMQTLNESMYNQARFAAALVGELLERNADADEIDQLSRHLGSELGLRITIIDAEGKVIADSDEDPALMENHSDRPEVITALENFRGTASRYSSTLDEDLFYMAVPLNQADHAGGDDGLRAVLRLALPLSSINRAISNLFLFILGALLISSLAALAAAYLLSGKITGPVRAITSAAKAIAGGNYNPPLKVGGDDELADLADNIKEMGAALQLKINQVTWEKNKIETVVSSMSSGIILTDQVLRIELINPAAEELFDLKRDSVIGKPFNLAIRYYALNENLKAVSQDGEARVMEVNLYYPRVAVLDTYIVPVYGSDRSIIGSLILFHETTVLRSLEKMRSDFVANVSHELRTPLTTVRGYTETILHEELSREQILDFLKVIDRETKRLSSLLDDLLDLAQIENEKGFVKKEPIDMQVLIREAVKRIEGARSALSVTINFDMPDHGIYVSGKPAWLRQALVNVLENSIKHGYEKGQIDISLAAAGSNAEIVIKDNGPGIPEEDLPYVFERFYRVDKARSRKSGSTGLGLSIVKHILEAHDASYKLQSKTGEGTAFILSLPLYKS